MTPLNLKLRLIVAHFGLFMQLNQQAKTGITVLAEVLYSDYQGELDCYSPKKLGKIMSGI